LDQGGTVVVNWAASGLDVFNLQTVTHYSVWRATQALPAGMEPAVTAPGDVVADFEGPAWRVEHSANGDYYWEWVGNQTAYYFAGYTLTAPTWYDSTGADPADHYFQVLSHTADQFVFWASCPDSGYSVDNLAPAAPMALTAARASGSWVELDWQASGLDEPDFKEYWIYRGEVSGFPTDPSHFLTNASDTLAIDGSADPSKAFFYKVVAVDIHNNPSDDSNEANVGVATGVGSQPPAINALTVMPNVPNPFSATTHLQIGLPTESDVKLEVYDVAGRRVYARVYARLAEGWRRLAFDGLDSSGRLLPSGVYFYQVTAAGMTQKQKMVISR
jgi:uncharacterized protein YbdZ (MbtH family)